MNSLLRPFSTRRAFLKRAGLFASAASLAPALLGVRTSAESSAKPLRILILGGTGFLGPACTEAAIARGHSVTHFNSGRTESRRKEAGRPSVVPQGVEQLIGNRDPDKTADDRRSEGVPESTRDPNSPRGLTQLKGKKWDAVVDTSGYFPRMVRASAELLAPNIRQYVFISSISVYADNSIPGYDESAQVRTLADPRTEEMGRNYENFGGAKALCERAAEAAMPGRVTNIRPGYIVGPRDTSGRFMYWPARVALGGDMIVPGDPKDPIQIIDARDLADWIVHCIEQNVVGVFNATGPEKELSMRGMLEGIQQGLKSSTKFEWMPLDFLQQNKIQLDRFPLYAPPSGETAGFHRCSIAKALKHGLRFRTVADTAKATFDWYESLPADLRPRLCPQLAVRPGEKSWLALEKETVAAWQSRAKTGSTQKG